MRSDRSRTSQEADANPLLAGTTHRTAGIAICDPDAALFDDPARKVHVSQAFTEQ
jgi:hypothetical protein